MTNSLYGLVGLSGFRCIVADPPWAYPEGFGIGRVPQGQVNDGRRNALPYDCMTLDEIKSLPVAKCAADGCHLYLWTTNRYLRQAFGVLDAWGFRYGQTLVWAKAPIGSVLGGAFPACLEFILFARRGKLRHIRRGNSAWWNWPRTCKHSRKPDGFFEMVEGVSPGPRLELFARRARPGWTTIGNEVDSMDVKDSLVLLTQGKHPCYGVEKHGESWNELLGVNGGTMDAYFTKDTIEHLVTDHNWEMVPANDGKYKLRQKDNHHIMTVDFEATEEAAHKFCVTPNARTQRPRAASGSME